MKNATQTADAIFERHGVVLTLGAEPTCVPVKPPGAEWSMSATGPTKLSYAYRLAHALVAQSLPGAAILFSPGKMYPGEVNPRWALQVLARIDGTPLAKPRKTRRKANDADAEALLKNLGRLLGCRMSVRKLFDPLRQSAPVWVLPIDHDQEKWASPAWRWPRDCGLLEAEGPAGLRIPWSLAKGSGPWRALTVEVIDDQLQMFLPPLWQAPWSELFAAVQNSLPSGVGCGFSGYVPEDIGGVWRGLVIAADPGVLEINLPPCRRWEEYDEWLRRLERAQKSAGLRGSKRGRDGSSVGTGGGHHLLFGGPSLVENPFFTRPAWLISILRFWQHHPSLSYLFTGCYVGSSAQAPRPDESGKSLWDLEMAYAWLEGLPGGVDHRDVLAGTLIHLHSDVAGNTHRSETSFDKFWNMRFPGGARGLIEFRAIESLPHAAWASAVALLWRCLAAFLLEHPFRCALRDFGGTLHDDFFLPSVLWDDLAGILAELRAAGVELPQETFRTIYDWRFPLLHEAGGLEIRRALDPWPLLCETPLEGGNTSRFVDTSVERLEFSASKKFARHHVLRVNGQELPLRAWKDGRCLAGLRYRASALNPSLHPGIMVQMPLVLEIERGRKVERFALSPLSRIFKPLRAKSPLRGEVCRRSGQGYTYDLRLT